MPLQVALSRKSTDGSLRASFELAVQGVGYTAWGLVYNSMAQGLGFGVWSLVLRVRGLRSLGL